MLRAYNGLSTRTLETRDRALSELTPHEIIRIQHDWLIWARDDQLPPLEAQCGGPWSTWLVLGGRGSGKTRTGAEWVRALALGIPDLVAAPARRIALLGETIAQVRSVMIEGVSGILSVHANHERPTLEISRNQLVWPNGAIAQMFSADDPESLRGPQFDAAWCDELAKWSKPQAAWDNLQFGLRLGEHPQVCVTTTPRPTTLVKDILKDPKTAVSRARTRDNAKHLAPTFLTEITRRYDGTSLGKQELDGEVVDTRVNGLWQRHWLAQGRLTNRPDMNRIVVAVDPPVTSTAGSDSCGIIVAGLTPDNRGVVLADRTIQGRDPQTWARAAIAAYRDYEADRIIAEVNQGGDLVVMVLKQVDPNVPVKKAYASRGKWSRAEPIAALYAEGRIHHLGEFPELERQMCDFGIDGLSNGRSPDRLDALVWAFTELMLSTPANPQVRLL